MTTGTLDSVRPKARSGTSFRPLPLLSGLALVLAGAACSPSAGDLVDSEENEALPGLCDNNSTMLCSCGDRAGRQVCVLGTWASCECAGGIEGSTGGAGGGGAGGGPSSVPTFEGNLRTDITFPWESTVAPVADGSCLPGRYEGNFQGWYWSILAPPGFGVPIANIEFPGGPSGFYFDLAPAQGGETIQKVKGEIDGIADLVFPFKAKIEGELNCRSATFTGRLVGGSYSVLIDGLLPQGFDGVLSAHYDKRTHTFVNGVWDVRESTAVPPGRLAPSLPHDYQRDGFGGSGEFATAFATDPNDPNVTACPATFTCGPGPLGPNKILCNTLLGPPACVTDAECAPLFPGENVPCLKAGPLALCLRECKP